VKQPLHSTLGELYYSTRCVVGGRQSKSVCVLSCCLLLFRCKQCIVLLLSTAVFSITRSLEAEPLLACVTSGMLLANKR